MAGFLVFFASVIFTIARIGSFEVVINVAFYATLASAYGASLAVFHLIKKTKILVNLQATLGQKAKNSTSSDSAENIRRVRGITWTQIFLTVLRILAALAAAIALPWAVYDRQIFLNSGKPMMSVSLVDASPSLWIAFGAVSGAIGATTFFFIIEYVIRYNLDPNLGPYICESFRDDIEVMFKILSLPINDIDAKQVQDRETWEYVAREFLHKYRFDTVFAADRFGAIFQYIQSGMDPR